MDRTIKRTCITVRRASRHPLVQRSLRSSTLMRKHIIRGAALSFIPATLNDIVIHHAAFTPEEVLHTATDTVTVSTMNAVLAILTIVSKTL